METDRLSIAVLRWRDGFDWQEARGLLCLSVLKSFQSRGRLNMAASFTMLDTHSWRRPEDRSARPWESCAAAAGTRRLWSAWKRPITRKHTFLSIVTRDFGDVIILHEGTQSHSFGSNYNLLCTEENISLCSEVFIMSWSLPESEDNKIEKMKDLPF